MNKAVVMAISALCVFAATGCGNLGGARVYIENENIKLEYDFDYVDNILLCSRMRTVLINADGKGLVRSNGSIYGYVTPERMKNHPRGSLIGWVFIDVGANGTGYIKSSLVENGPIYTGYKLYRRDGDHVPAMIYQNDGNVAQQVDSAEASTTAVPPFEPSGSPR